MSKIKKSILITNDDGYKSEGIYVLKDIGNQFSDKIYTIAPKKNQSGKSHSITINKNIEIKKVSKNSFYISGSPVDCIIAGIGSIIPKNNMPSLILSGINNGQNIGRDIFYSGTVGAAREGSLNGIQSIAISIEKNKNKTNWDVIYKFAPLLINKIISIKSLNNIYFNINFPNVNVSRIKGYKLVDLGERKPGLVIRKYNKNSIFIPSERNIMKNAKIGEDEYELSKGFITLSIHKVLCHKTSPSVYKSYISKIRKLIEK